MKIQERAQYVWKNNQVEHAAPAKFNVDGVEILKWMRELSKLPIGLKEMAPKIKESGTAIGRFADATHLKGKYVCVYVVREDGLYKQWVDINSEKFTNNGRCTNVSALSKEKVLMHIMKYKSNCSEEAPDAISDFVRKYNERAEAEKLKDLEITVKLDKDILRKLLERQDEECVINMIKEDFREMVRKFYF